MARRYVNPHRPVPDRPPPNDLAEAVDQAYFALGGLRERLRAELAPQDRAAAARPGDRAVKPGREAAP